MSLSTFRARNPKEFWTEKTDERQIIQENEQSVQKKQMAAEFFASMSRTLIIKAADFN